eukprot:Mrub_11281.p1 GENE.Mrub_11281~~Mrub_11281.p1  ORF type:complete len:198 (-),score=28.22 Mrub_11281:34-591(-)
MIKEEMRIHKHTDINIKISILKQMAYGLKDMLNKNMRKTSSHTDFFKSIEKDSITDFPKTKKFERVKSNSSFSIMSPEVYTCKDNKINNPVYIWSYGMILYEIITREIIIESESEEEGYYIVKSFLKKKTSYIDNLINCIDQNAKDNSNHRIIRKKLVYIFEKCVRKEPSKRIDIEEIVNILSQL